MGGVDAFDYYWQGGMALDGMELGLVQQDPGPLSVGQLLGGLDGLESCGSCDPDGRGRVNPVRGIGPAAAGGLWDSDGDGSGVSQGGILPVSGMYSHTGVVVHIVISRMGRLDPAEIRRRPS